LVALVTCTPWVSMREEKKLDIDEDTAARCGEVLGFLGKVIRPFLTYSFIPIAGVPAHAHGDRLRLGLRRLLPEHPQLRVGGFVGRFICSVVSFWFFAVRGAALFIFKRPPETSSSLISVQPMCVGISPGILDRLPLPWNSVALLRYQPLFRQ
jgi:hypothetical protein